MVHSAFPPRVLSGAESPRWNVGREKGMFGISKADLGLREACWVVIKKALNLE